MLAGVRGGNPLCKSHVRTAAGADTAVAPRLIQNPFLRVPAVVTLVCERFPFALGGSLAPAVLTDEDVSAPGVEQAVTIFLIALAVWGTEENDGEFAVGLRKEDIRGKLITVSHRNLHIGANVNFVGLYRGENRLRRQ